MLHFASVRGKPCRCLSAGVIGRIRQTMETGNRLYVESLDPEMQSQGLWETCSLFGSVLDCKVELDEDERSRCYGFVHFAQKEDAKKALTFMNGVQIGSCAIEL